MSGIVHHRNGVTIALFRLQLVTRSAITATLLLLTDENVGKELKSLKLGFILRQVFYKMFSFGLIEVIVRISDPNKVASK